MDFVIETTEIEEYKMLNRRHLYEEMITSMKKSEQLLQSCIPC